jgi:hypothetical protein
MNNQTQTATRTLYLPCAWLGYIDYQCVTTPETIWEINSTLGAYKGYGVKISEFVEITEDQPFLYDYNGSGHPVPCYEYIFQDTRELLEDTGYQPIEPDLLFECALLNLGDELQSLRPEITRLMNKSADQGNIEANRALCDILRAVDDFCQSI